MGPFPASARGDNPAVCHSFQHHTGPTGGEQRRLPASVSAPCEEQRLPCSPQSLPNPEQAMLNPLTQEQCLPRSPQSLPNPEQAMLLLANPLTQAITLGQQPAESHAQLLG